MLEKGAFSEIGIGWYSECYDNEQQKEYFYYFWEDGPVTEELDDRRLELRSVKQEIAYTIDREKDAVMLLGRIKDVVSSFRLFAPTIEEYANQVEADKTIGAGNSFRGILYEIGKLLEAFKEMIKEGLCWFPRLMRWKTSKGEVATVFIEKSNG